MLARSWFTVSYFEPIKTRWGHHPQERLFQREKRDNFQTRPIRQASSEREHLTVLEYTEQLQTTLTYLFTHSKSLTATSVCASSFAMGNLRCMNACNVKETDAINRVSTASTDKSQIMRQTPRKVSLCCISCQGSRYSPCVLLF